MPRKKVIPEPIVEPEEEISDLTQTIGDNVADLEPESEELPEFSERQSESAEEVRYISPEGNGSLKDHDQELDDLITPEISVEAEDILITSVQHRDWQFPWWAIVLLALVVGLIIQTALAWIGSQWFWSERLLYSVSLIMVFFLCLGAAYVVSREPEASIKKILIINLLIALLIGILLSVSLFVQNAVSWTLFNLIGQPVNVMILSLAASWLASKIFLTTSPARFDSSSARRAGRNNK